jgi:hypothetical protein
MAIGEDRQRVAKQLTPEEMVEIDRAANAAIATLKTVLPGATITFHQQHDKDLPAFRFEVAMRGKTPQKMMRALKAAYMVADLQGEHVDKINHNQRQCYTSFEAMEPILVAATDPELKTSMTACWQKALAPAATPPTKPAAKSDGSNAAGEHPAARGR